MSNYIAAIDLGTTKVVTILGEKRNNGRFRIVAHSDADSLGVRRGQVENIQHVIEAIRPTLQNVKEAAGIEEMPEVFVGIAGQHIRCIESRADSTRNAYDVEISEDEVRRLETDMYKIRMEPGEEVLHVIPQHYSVDDSNGISDPVGRLGQRLSGNFHVIIGKTSSVHHTELCIRRLGLTQKRLILEPLASAHAVLNDDEKEMGVAMIDMGGGTTDLAVYHDGIVRHTAVIPFGGNIITEDIKRGCEILLRQAEQVKVQYGSCLASMVSNNKIITVPGIAGRESREIGFKSLASIIEARLDEIIGMVMMEINRSGYAKKLGAGIVLTGGGSKLKDLPEFIKLKTGMDVRLGKPEYTTSDSAKEILQPKFSTAVGLIMCGADYLQGKPTSYEEVDDKINAISVENIGKDSKAQNGDQAISEIVNPDESAVSYENEKPKSIKGLMQVVLDFFEESKNDTV